MGEIKWVKDGKINITPDVMRINVFYTDDNYTAQYSGWSETGPSAAYALRALAQRFEAAEIYGSDKELIEKLTVKKDADCKHCSAPIFFAALPFPSTKYLAFDPEPFPIEQTYGVRAAIFTAGEDHRGRRTIKVKWVGPTHVGVAWVPHPECCGGKVDPPLNPALNRRWQKRRDQFRISAETKHDVIEGLKEIAREMDKGLVDAE